MRRRRWASSVLLDLRPLDNRRELDDALAAITETIVLNEEKQVSWSFSGLEDPSDAVAILKIQNASLEPNLMLEIARVCTQALFARSSIQPEKEFAPTLWQIVEHIPPTLLAVIDQINKKLLPGGEIDDSASPELAKLRREINAQQARLTKSLESAMRAAGTAIQDEIVTVRNDRFVIPVKTDFRGKVGWRRPRIFVEWFDRLRRAARGHRGEQRAAKSKRQRGTRDRPHPVCPDRMLFVSSFQPSKRPSRPSPSSISSRPKSNSPANSTPSFPRSATTTS